MALTWSKRRQSLYYTVGLFFVLLMLMGVYQSFFTATPTCFDGKQNAAEGGIDCDGSCALVCSATARAPVVRWARSFQTAPKTYTAAAYIENNNVGAAARGVGYTFQIFDERNTLIVERHGTLDITPISVVAIVEPNIDIGNRTPARTLFAFSGTPVWYRQQKQPPLLRVTNQALEPDGSRLAATLVNDQTVAVRGVGVAAVLFDATGVARAASKTTVDVAARSRQDIVFTWPQGTPDILRAEITVLPPL